MNNVQRKTNDLALIGFILSFFLGPVGSILCYFGLEQIKKTGEAGRDMAIAGMIIGIVPLVIAMFVLIIYVLVFGFTMLAFIFALIAGMSVLI